MPETFLIRLVPPTFPEGFCPPDLQAEWAAGFALAHAELLINGVTGFYNFGPGPVPPNNQVFPWIKTSGVDFTPEDVYTYGLGYWITLYKFGPPGPNGFRTIYEGTEDSVLTVDGGENAPVGLATGPFWEIDHNYDGRIPMGAGVITGAAPAKTLGVGENYGEAAHLQLPDEVAAHTHPISSGPTFSHDGVVDVVNSGGTDPTIDGLAIGLTGAFTTPLTVGANSPSGTAQTASPIIPPVKAVFFLMRTIRKFRRG